MTRYEFLERNSMQIYGGYATDDAVINYNVINSWLSDAIGVAAKQNYKDNIAIDGIGFVNNSFYTTFKGISLTKDENFTWKLSLPQIPLGIGRTEGIETLKFKSSTNEVSLPGILISSNEATFFQTMRPIPNKVICKPEGGVIYAISTLLLSAYTCTVTLISGGNGSDLTSTLNVPADYFPVMVEYLKAQLAFERAQPQDISNDGRDSK